MGISIALNLLLVNYFFPFSDGKVIGGELLRFSLKILSVFLSIYGLGHSGWRIVSNSKNLLFFFSLTALLIAIRLPYYGLADLKFMNVYLCLPFLLLGNLTEKNYYLFDRILFFSFLVWCCIDFTLFLTSNSIWSSGAFIGGVGNPSSYGFLLIYLYEVVSSRIRKRTILLVFRIFIILSLFLTQALMPILLFLFLQFLKIPRIFIVLTTFGLFASLLFLDSLIELLPDTYWSFKLIKLLNFLQDFDVSKASTSIAVRIEFFKSLSELNSSVYRLLFGGVNQTYYNFGDSQIVTYLTSFGLISFAFFFLFMRNLLAVSRHSNLRLFVMAFVLILFTNRILDYWPIPMLVFLVINRVESEKRFI